MRPAAFLFCALALSAQQPQVNSESLLVLTDRLRAAMEAGDWKKAAELSSALKNATAEARGRALLGKNNEEIDRVLGWLPENTETIVVAQQPFILLEGDPNSVADALTEARGYVLNLLGPANDAELVKALYGTTVRFAVLAARRFENHKADERGAIPLGMIAYQGCAAYAFGTAVRDAAFTRLPDSTILNHEVWTLTGDEPDDKVLISFLKPDLILACNDKDFFSSVLSRINEPPKETKFRRLPEWSQVDHSASVWGLRHFIPEAREWDPTHPANAGVTGTSDAGAIGITLQVGLPRGKVSGRWLSTSKTNYWDDLVSSPDFGNAASTRKIGEGVWELSANDESGPGTFAVFALMAMLGFAVLL
jgi:hypothetical protein